MEKQTEEQEKKKLVKETILALQKRRQSIELDEDELIESFEQKIREVPPKKDTSRSYYPIT